MVLGQIIISTVAISLLSLVGLLTISINKKAFSKIILSLVALSAGALMGGAFIHLIPEAVETGNENTYLYVLTGLVIFFVSEKALWWRHCHKEVCEVHTFAYMNLIGEALHNFIDGLIIAASFLANASLGVATVIATALHEIPQEMGDFGVLIHGGFTKKKAITYNFLIALTAVLGGIIGFYLIDILKIESALLAIAAGGFIYIGASDLMPELRKETGKKSIITMTIFILGIIIMWLTGLME